MKRIISLLLAVFVLISVFVLSSCSGSAPKLENVKERFIYLIENSKELNTVYFGKGLPVYDRDGTLAKEKGVYYNDELTAYNKVMERSKCLSIDEIKARSMEIYSSEYLSALYETAFDGVMTGSSSAYLRFYESDDWLYENIYATDFEFSERIYDYSSMQIVKPSNNEYINIIIDSYTLKDREIKSVSLTFVYENDNWYLDSPTY